MDPWKWRVSGSAYAIEAYGVLSPRIVAITDAIRHQPDAPDNDSLVYEEMAVRAIYEQTGVLRYRCAPRGFDELDVPGGLGAHHIYRRHVLRHQLVGTFKFFGFLFLAEIQ